MGRKGNSSVDWEKGLMKQELLMAAEVSREYFLGPL